ncbi:hypothetical protein [Streptomyces californicus]|uniref:hypothetical protein n=1 Tax=Streptomyces californicus TaxID=67351 RepID=UPI00379AFB1C
MLYGHPGATTVEVDAVAVLVLAEPDEDARLAWIDHCWGFDGQRLRQYTTDHTMGEHLRCNGGELLNLKQARLHDNWVLTTDGGHAR